MYKSKTVKDFQFLFYFNEITVIYSNIWYKIKKNKTCTNIETLHLFWDNGQDIIITILI